MGPAVISTDPRIDDFIGNLTKAETIYMLREGLKCVDDEDVFAILKEYVERADIDDDELLEGIASAESLTNDGTADNSG